MLVYDLDAYARGHAYPGEVAPDPRRWSATGSIAGARLAVDAFVKVVLHDGTKVDTIIHYGRRRPTIAANDLGSRRTYPTSTAWRAPTKAAIGGSDSQWDHVDPAADDGTREPTRTSNRSAYPHHREKTERDRAAGCSTATARERNRKERGPP